VQGLLPILQQYGIESNPKTFSLLSEKLKNLYPELKIAGLISPPFRPLRQEEDDVYVKKINDSGADILFAYFEALRRCLFK
jgi:N-acetylglucosaminyldiphosphoundecaprenol N-acetyl-beta-D-mannosaminyltransferase